MLYSEERVRRFWSRVDRRGPDECWVWTSTLNEKGYGRFCPRVNGRVVHVFAYRYAYNVLVGEIPSGLQPDHTCRNRACVNPAHLDIVTPRENVLRSEAPSAVNARKVSCIHGHPFSLENTYVTPDGRRMCRACQARRSAVRSA